MKIIELEKFGILPVIRRASDVLANGRPLTDWRGNMLEISSAEVSLRL